MPVTLYYAPASPPCRAVMLTAGAVDVSVDVKNIDLRKGEHKSAAYKKLNPQHTVPFFQDGEYELSESRAIMCYLADQYDKSGTLLPKDARKRALVTARLLFDATNLYPALRKAYLAPIVHNIPATDDDFAALRESLSILDSLIGNDNNYLVGSQLTIADIAIATTLSNLEIVGHDLEGFKNVNRLYQNAKSVIPRFEEVNLKAPEILHFISLIQKK